MEWNFRTAQLSDLDRVTEIEYICFPGRAGRHPRSL